MEASLNRMAFRPHGLVPEWELLARIMNHVASRPSSNGPSAFVASVDDPSIPPSMLNVLGGPITSIARGVLARDHVPRSSTVAWYPSDRRSTLLPSGSLVALSGI